MKAISAADNVSGFWSNPVDFTIADVDRGSLLGRELPMTSLDRGEARESNMRPAVALIVDSQEVADDREQTRQQRANAAIADRPSSLPVQEGPSRLVVPRNNASADTSAATEDLTEQVMTERLMADLGWLDQK